MKGFSTSEAKTLEDIFTGKLKTHYLSPRNALSVVSESLPALGANPSQRLEFYAS